MGRSPCCDKVGLKKGPWTPEEDQTLLAYVEKHGHGSWRALPAKAGLQRCGKSCRLRWTNYLRPDIKRGEFSLQEEQSIIQLHALLGNRWSAIATHLPRRTDNEIKNFWNTHLKKRLAKMGIDPCTHKARSGTLSPAAGGHSRSAANLSHMAQWESARLEAEARLVRESKLRAASNSAILQQQQQMASCSSSSSSSAFDVLREWPGVWSTKPQGERVDLASPTSTLTFSENRLPVLMAPGRNAAAATATSHQGGENWGPPEGGEWKCLAKDRAEGLAGFSVEVFSGEAPWLAAEPYASWAQFGAGFTGMLLGDSGEHNLHANGHDDTCAEQEEEEEEEDEEEEEEADDEEEEGGEVAGKNNSNNIYYWNSILDAVNSSSSSSPRVIFN